MNPIVFVLAGLGVLGAGAVVSLLLTKWPRVALVGAMGTIGVAAGLHLVAAGALLVHSGGALTSTVSWPMPLGNVGLGLDGLGAWFLLTASILSLAIAIYSVGYMKTEIAHARGSRFSVPTFGALMCLLIGSMVVAFCATDAILFLVSWEIMALAGFFLILFHDVDEKVRRGAWTYVIATHLGAAIFLLPMFAILIARSGSINFADFATLLHSADLRFCVMIFALGLISFGTKAGFMPMHVWLPNAHPVAPTPVSAILSAVVIKCGIFGLLRLLTWLPTLPPACGAVMLLFGAISGVLGVLYAMAQSDLKRMLAYSSVENIGIIGLGIGLGMLGQSTGHPMLALLGFTGAMLHVLNHALFKGLLFLSAGAVIHSTGTGQMDRLGGLARKTPMNALLFLVATLSICALPPFNGFVSEWLIYRGLFGAAGAMGTHVAIPVIGLALLSLIGGLALACFAKALGIIFLGEARDPAIAAHGVPFSMKFGMSILAVLCLVVGLVPVLVIPLVSGGIMQLLPGAVDLANPRMTLAELLPGPMITCMGLLFIGMLLVLVGLRWFVGRRNAPIRTGVGTWGCGYAYASPRVQYTGSSFGWTLVTIFKNALWPERKIEAPAGYFPTAGSVATRVPDVAENDVYTPLFQGVDRACRMIQTVSWEGQPRPENISDSQERVGPFRAMRRALLAAARRGSIQTCLTYIVLTLLVLFLVETVAAPKSNPAKPTPEQNISRVEGVNR